MKHDDLISVIVPVYNCEALVREALQSLRCQTYHNFEVIAVNDGSTDGSADICRHFGDDDARFKLINQQNRGVSAARNAGIDVARGKWIVFVDADDLLLPDALESLVNSAYLTNAEIVVGNYIRGKKCPPYSNLQTKMDTEYKVLTSDEAIKTGLYQKRILNNIWGVLYDRKLFNGRTPLRFKHCKYEDLDIFYKLFMLTDNICILDKIVYFYRDFAGSFMNNWSDARLDVLDVTDSMVNYFKDYSPELLRAAQDRRFSAHYNMLVEMRRHHVDNQQQRQRCVDVIKEYRRAELTDVNVRLKNKVGALLSYIIL